MGRKKELVRRFAKEGLILSASGFGRILGSDINPDEVLRKAKENKLWLVTDEFIQEFVILGRNDEREILKDKTGLQVCESAEVKPPVTEPPAVIETAPAKPPAVVVERPKRRVFAQEIEPKLKIYDDSDVTGKSTCDGRIENFMEYFNQRYNGLSGILRERIDYSTAVPIEAVRKNGSGNDKSNSFRIICMVCAKRESDKGYRFLDVEDPSGSLTVFIPKDKTDLNRVYDSILTDEVIGVEGVLKNSLFIANNITQPDLPVVHNTPAVDEPVQMALLSDIHVGSILFLEREFQNFIDWLNGKGGGRKDASPDNIKYILVAGDLVDGIGIYPHQERELSIPDIYKQYDFLSLLIEQIPDYIEVVLSMGNHDAVRNAEPQPKLSKDVGGRLYELPNVHIVGNPVMVSTHGVKTLVYHGTTLDTMIGSLPDCSYSSPENAMIHYLKKRSLAPMYGNDQIAPENRDYMMIKEIPDILHCGHIHTNGYATYRGVRVINSGTWQGRTKYQEQQGHTPTPARVPIINLQNLEVSVMKFGA